MDLILSVNFRAKEIPIRRAVAVIKKRRFVLMKQHAALQATRPGAKQNLKKMKARKEAARKGIQEQSKRRRLQTLHLNQIWILRNPPHQIHLRALVPLTQSMSHQINALTLLKGVCLLMDLKCPTLLKHLKHTKRRPQVLRRNKMSYTSNVITVQIICSIIFSSILSSLDKDNLSSRWNWTWVVPFSSIFIYLFFFQFWFGFFLVRFSFQLV